MDNVPRIAWRPLALVCTIVFAVLFGLSGRYGYHRDELYYLAAGRHLAWGYDEQPPLVVLLARLADEVAGGALMVLRLPGTLALTAIVLLTGLIARELGGAAKAQTLAAVATRRRSRRATTTATASTTMSKGFRSGFAGA